MGVLLDWVPGHFPDDPHGLGQFDGTALYEHAKQRGSHHGMARWARNYDQRLPQSRLRTAAYLACS